MKKLTTRLKSSASNLFFYGILLLMIMSFASLAFSGAHTKKHNIISEPSKSFKDSLCEVCVERNSARLGVKNANYMCKGFIFQLDSIPE